jgi:hypothetical protein
VGTLLGFGGRFGAFDVVLKLLLEGFLEKLSSLDEEERFDIVECFAVGGAVGNEIALVEKGIKFGVEKFAGVQTGGC